MTDNNDLARQLDRTADHHSYLKSEERMLLRRAAVALRAALAGSATPTGDDDG
jgi:hypothetical protein